ncbi:MAG: FadR family transcriptional regulator [Kutzneria sp.]|nr:FadR family transcriptional regulator [Kutzneria sp.]MBV9845370.1 FadR family transcriptional regulator [Kutzneria sp.]
MPLAATRRAGLVDQVIEQMRQAISSGEWPVGRRIPAEPELVTALGVGRNTVREAVRALAHAGLLEVRQGDGTFVRATSELSGAVRRLVDEELLDVLEVRRALEVEGARLAAIRRTDEDVRGLEELLDERNAAEARQNWPEMIERDTLFHLMVVQSSHNAVLAELHRGLTEVIRASVAVGVTDTPGGAKQISHDGLLEAIRGGDSERAAREASVFLDDLLERHAADRH